MDTKIWAQNADFHTDVNMFVKIHNKPVIGINPGYIGMAIIGQLLDNTYYLFHLSLSKTKQERISQSRMSIN